MRKSLFGAKVGDKVFITKMDNTILIKRIKGIYKESNKPKKIILEDWK